MLLRPLSCLVVLTALSCGPPPTSEVAPTTSAAATAEPAAPVAESEEPDDAAAPSSSAVAAAKPSPSPGATASAGPAASAPVGVPLAASSPAGKPAATPALVPAASSAEQRLIDMCQGKVSMFTDQETALLKKIDAAGRQDLAEQAASIRERRVAQLEITCAKLRGEGKL